MSAMVLRLTKSGLSASHPNIAAQTDKIVAAKMTFNTDP
jgi:hypothetical protein